jgi:transposase
MKTIVINHYNKKSNPIKDTLAIFNISNGSLYNWVNKNKKNILTNEKRYTKTSKYTPEIKCYIRQYILRRPNFDMNKLIVMIKKKYNVIGKKTSIYKIIKQLNLSYKKVNTRFIYGTKKNHTNKIKIFKKIIKPLNKDDIISIDETSVDTHISNLYGWTNKGKKLVKIINQLRKRYTVICAISNKQIIHYKILMGSANAETFKTFLEELSSKGINNKYLLLDNARIHHSKIVKAFMLNSTNKLLFNVAYSPEFNPIERIFSKVKSIIRKKLTNQMASKLINNIKSSLMGIKQEDFHNCYEKSLNF